jgi:hypothetical protein
MAESSSSAGPSGGLPGDSASASATGFCTACGASYGVGQSYCGHCGNRLNQYATPGSSRAPTSTDAATTSSTADPQFQAAGSGTYDSPYGTGATVGAVVLTLVLPVIALIAAIALRSQERGPGRRQFLKNWAIGSAAWLCTGWLISIIAFSVAVSSVSGCQGGINQAIPPSYQSSDGVHWVATFTCMNGGTETKPVPSSQVPGG